MANIKGIEAKESMKGVNYSNTALWEVTARVQAWDGPSLNGADDNLNGEEGIDMKHSVKK